MAYQLFRWCDLNNFLNNDENGDDITAVLAGDVSNGTLDLGRFTE